MFKKYITQKVVRDGHKTSDTTDIVGGLLVKNVMSITSNISISYFYFN